MKINPLGKKTSSPNGYDPDLLFPISRDFSRSKLKSYDSINIHGFDLWRAYEVSWLDKDGKPQVRVAEFQFSSTSKNIIESKSLKLYLNSLNNEIFKCEIEVFDRLTNDLTIAAGQKVLVVLKPLNSADLIPKCCSIGESLDEVDNFHLFNKPHYESLELTDVVVTDERLYSELFRSLCPVASQPDWGTFQIQYSGVEIKKESLLEYICSYRNHASFHEDCGERIFCEIYEYCKPFDLTISLNFLRRGGLDISVHRSTNKSMVKAYLPRLLRQ